MSSININVSFCVCLCIMNGSFYILVYKIFMYFVEKCFWNDFCCKGGLIGFCGWLEFFYYFIYL